MVFMLLMSLESEKDRKIMTDIYNKYNKTVFYVALKIMKTQDVAEEVAQDVWTKVVEKFERISCLADDEMKPYLTVMTRNMAFNYLKSEKKKTSYSFEELQENGDSRIKLYETLSGAYDLKFEVKRDSLFNRTFDINGKKIDISGAEWQSYYNNMNMRLPDGDKADAGSSAQKIMLNADIQGKLADKLKLTGLELKPNSDYINNYEYNGKKLIYENADKTANEENASDNGADITACIENIKPHIASALIEISGISYELKDDIIIKLAV